MHVCVYVLVATSLLSARHSRRGMRERAVLLLLLALFVGLVSAFNYREGPVQFLDVTEDHARFELVDEGLEFLRSIEAPFAIVAVGGAAKSGKSSLLNQILNVSNSVGFDGAVTV